MAISHFTSSGGKQFCNYVSILLSINKDLRFETYHFCVVQKQCDFVFIKIKKKNNNNNNKLINLK